VAVGTSIGQVKLFNPRTGELVRSLDDEKAKLADRKTPENWKLPRRAMGSVASLQFSPDGSLLAMCGGSFDDFSSVFSDIRQSREASADPGRLKVWEVTTGTLKHDLVGHSHATAAAFSPDGKLLASAGNWLSTRGPETGAILWNLTAGTPVLNLRTTARGVEHAIAFSTDGKLAALGWQPFEKEGDARANVVSVFSASSGAMEWKKTFAGLEKPVAFMPNDPAVVVLCHGEFFWLDMEEGGKILAAICPSDYKAGARWEDFAIAPQGYRLAVRGATKDKREFVEVVDFGIPRAAANSTAVKDGGDQDGKQGTSTNAGRGE
jgi:WD40 repeat protein